jgi:hypothetical protein
MQLRNFLSEFFRSNKNVILISFQVIMDPNLDWDKSFISPSSSKASKSTLEDKATFWESPPTTRASKAKGCAAAPKANNAMAEISTGAPSAQAKSTGQKAKNDKLGTTNNASEAKPNQTQSNKITTFFGQNGSSKDTKSVRERKDEADVVSLYSDEEKENAPRFMKFLNQSIH